MRPIFSKVMLIMGSEKLLWGSPLTLGALLASWGVAGSKVTAQRVRVCQVYKEWGLGLIDDEEVAGLDLSLSMVI